METSIAVPVILSGNYPPVRIVPPVRNRVTSYYHFVDGIKPSANRPFLYFWHDTIPHIPYEFMPSGKAYAYPTKFPRGYNTKWSEDTWAITQAYQAFLLQVVACDKLLGAALDKLEKEGLFDSALIVVAADHGVTFEPGRDRRGEIDSPHFYEDVMSVPLLIKRPGQQQGRQLTMNVQTIDILPSVAQLLGVSIPHRVDGTSAYAESRSATSVKIVKGQWQLSSRKERREQKREGTADLVTFKMALKPPLPLDTVKWKEQIFGDGRSDPGALYHIGPFPELLGKELDQIPVRKEEGMKVAIDSSVYVNKHGTYVHYHPEAQTIPSFVMGRIELSSESKQPVPVALAVNNTIAATTFAERVKGDDFQFSALIPEEAFKRGRNYLVVSIVRSTDTGPVLIVPVR
jgi:hypothetical protein